MRVLIGKPTRHLDMFAAATEQGLMRNDDVVRLYDMLPDIVDELGHDHVVIDIKDNMRRIYQEKDSIYLAWHTHGTTTNTWFVKQSYLPDYFYFDKTGYSGWSELADSYDYDVDVDEIRDEVNAFAEDYIANNTSRFIQQHDLPIPNEPYVVVFTQRADDAVSVFAYIDDLADKVIEAYKDTGYKVVVKEHPLELEWTNKGWVWRVNEKTGSLHKLIAGSSAVYTVNSGTGFEALLHKKRVFTAGHCDYHWVTNILKNEDNIVASIELLEQPVNEDAIIKFLHYCLNHYFMNVNDKDSIKRKLIRAADWYEIHRA